MTKTFANPTCLICGQGSVTTVTDEQYEALMDGAVKVQDVLPDFTVDQRELVISGTHPACWELAFGGDEDD